MKCTIYIILTEGYLTLWDVSKFLEKPESGSTALIKQMICWRAHLTKVIQLTSIDTLKAIISGSTDESVRLEKCTAVYT